MPQLLPLIYEPIESAAFTTRPQCHNLFFLWYMSLYRECCIHTLVNACLIMYCQCLNCTKRFYNSYLLPISSTLSIFTSSKAIICCLLYWKYIKHSIKQNIQTVYKIKQQIIKQTIIYLEDKGNVAYEYLVWLESSFQALSIGTRHIWF